MANFATPFASTGPRRTPNADEKANGFPCGAADQTLFNGMFHRIEAELGELITFAGLTPTDAQHNQVRLAVQALIAAATGGGEPEDYLLLNQATSRLPILPELLAADGVINVTSPANGVVRLPGGINFLHRGISPYVTVQTDFNTVSSRTYHLRWTPTGGFQLRHLGDNTYNPDGLAETDEFFDTSYDSMLIARVVTNSSNVPTVTNLRNARKLVYRNNVNGPAARVTTGSGDDGSRFSATFVHNWASRSDIVSIFGWAGNHGAEELHGRANVIAYNHNRYSTYVEITSDFNRPLNPALLNGAAELHLVRS